METQYASAPFYRPDALPVTQPTVSGNKTEICPTIQWWEFALKIPVFASWSELPPGLISCCHIIYPTPPKKNILADRQTKETDWQRQKITIIRQYIIIKKRSQRRKHRALAVARWSQKMFVPPQTPYRGAGRLKLNQLETVTIFTYKPSLVRIDACNFELSR